MTAEQLQPSRRERRCRRQRHLTAAVITLTGVGLLGGVVDGVGAANAVDPGTLRSNCIFSSETERAQNIQTCLVASPSMKSQVIIKVRPSDQEAGGDEQGVYLLGGPVTSGTTLGEAFGSSYNLVVVLGGVDAYSTNWRGIPLDAKGNPLTNLTGGLYTPRWEDFIADELPGYLQTNFDVDPTNNAIVGLSESGGQAVNLALKHPDLFKVVLAISGYYHTDNPLGWFLIPEVLREVAGVSNASTAMWGNPFARDNDWAVNDVSKNIRLSKANDQTILLVAGNGRLRSWDEFRELWSAGGIRNVVGSIALEMLSALSARLIRVMAVLRGLPVQVAISDGAHSVVHWTEDLPSYVAFVESGLAKYRTGGQGVSVSGVSVSGVSVPGLSVAGVSSVGVSALGGAAGVAASSVVSVASGDVAESATVPSGTAGAAAESAAAGSAEASSGASVASGSVGPGSVPGASAPAVPAPSGSEPSAPLSSVPDSPSVPTAPAGTTSQKPQVTGAEAGSGSGAVSGSDGGSGSGAVGGAAGSEGSSAGSGGGGADGSAAGGPGASSNP